MEDYRVLAKELCDLPGLSGYEHPVRDRIRLSWEPLADEVWVSPLGSLHAIKHGCGAEPRRRLLVAAHMDAVGMIVTKIEKGGFLRFTSVGGLDPRILPYQPVCVLGRELLSGIIAAPSERQLPESLHGKAFPMEYLFIDTGLDEERVKSLVHPGDMVSFANKPIDIDMDTLMAHTLDDRASVVAATVALQLLQSRKHEWDIVFAATVQEEVGLKGARTSGFQAQPDLAIAVDVGFAKEPGASGYFLLEPGSGPAIAWGPVCHPGMAEMILSMADQLTIPHTKEINPSGRTGTDGDAISLVGTGIPTSVFSIPLRFMHSPVEMVRYEDMYQTGRLIAEFAASLDKDTMPNLLHDDTADEEE
ncbi:MAG: M42 family peptidase [Anaerolineae bacterium]|nr:M42 family peptidase [Anaerolineae bacterium]